MENNTNNTINANNSTTPNRAITLTELKLKSKGTLIDIPDFEDEKTIKVRVKKVDFSKQLLNGKYNLASFLSGSITGKLAKLNENDDIEREKIIREEMEKDSENNESIEDIFNMIDVICKECLIEPTWLEFEEIYPLTINQKYSIFRWVISGIKDLQPFR